MIVICVILVLVASLEFSNIIVYGWFISKNTTEVFMKLEEKNLRLNQFNSSILSTNPYITNHFSLFAKYYIKGLGIVPRFSKLEKKIDEYFAIACKNGQ